MENKRIKELAKYVNGYNSVCDVGCDHGYLIREVLTNYHITYALAIDNKEKPLESAYKNLSKFNNVEYLLSDGLEKVNKKIDCVVIAGMGGMLIVNILKNALLKKDLFKRFILQPNKDCPKVRKFLIDNGFVIVDEDIVYEKGHFYEIIIVENGNSFSLTNIEILFGPILLKKRPQTFIENLQYLKEKYELKAPGYKKEYLNMINEVLENEN